MLNGNAKNFDTILYHVRLGDSLGAIIRHYYGPLSLEQQNAVIRQIQAENPEVTNPNLIYPGQALIIDIPQQHSTSLASRTPIIQAGKDSIKPLQQQWQKSTPPEKELLSALAPIMLGAGSAGMMMIDTTFRTNVPLVAEMAKNYNDLKKNKVTKAQYDHKRRSLLQQLKTKLGPTNLLLNGSRSPHEVLRISKSKNSTPIWNITGQINKMNLLSKVAARGGVVLSVAGLGVACYEIANANNSQKRNEILIESLGGVAGGALYGAAAIVTIAIMATPIGWVGALAIGVGGALTGAAAGYGTKYWYRTSGTQIDFTKITKVDQLCR